MCKLELNLSEKRYNNNTQMKKILGILILILMWSGNAYSKSIEFSNCYTTHILSTGGWFPLKGSWKEYQANTGLSKEMKESGKFPNGSIIDSIIKINSKNNTIISRTIYTDEYAQHQKEEKNSTETWTLIFGKTTFDKEKYSDHYYKIKSYVGGQVEGFDKNGEVIRIDIQKATIQSSMVREKCEKGGFNNSNYLDYWWAVILIIAITLFIFTQSGKRLKMIRRK